MAGLDRVRQPEPPLPEALAGVSALLHLGHSWTGDGAGADEANVNLIGAERMARAALKLGVRDVADAAKVSPNTVTRLEAGLPVNNSTLSAIRSALARSGRGTGRR